MKSSIPLRDIEYHSYTHAYTENCANRARHAASLSRTAHCILLKHIDQVGIVVSNPEPNHLKYTLSFNSWLIFDDARDREKQYA
jgi:hypothetical protein